VLRGFEQGDLPEVARLHSLLYRHEGHDDVEWYCSLWRWLETHPLADAVHRWVLVAEEEVVGFLSAVPQFYRISGSRVVAHTPMDFMVQPRYRFHSIALMREFFRSCPNCVTCDWLPETVKVTMWLGEEEAGMLEHAARVLDAAALVGTMPRALRPAAAAALTGFTILVDAVSLGWKDDDRRIEELQDFDERFDVLFQELAAKLPCLPEKDSSFLGWRYGPGSPHPQRTIGYILDLTALPGRRDVASALLRSGVRRLRQLGSRVIRYRFLKSAVSPRLSDLWRLGFFPRKQRHRLLVRFAEPELHESARHGANWAYSAGDGEMSFWVR